MSATTTEAWGAFGKFVVALIVSLAMLAFHGAVLRSLWGWYGAWTGLSLTYAQSCGALILLSYLKSSPSDLLNDDTDALDRWLARIVIGLFFWSLGWALHFVIVP